ncbi:MAG: hypothetical protein IPH95_02355 [Candidatus Promineofilum sp.]|nr:hypothetical protein [Promineifilum sp.]
MNFRDRWEENEQGERFVFTVEMQRRLSQAGLPIEPSALAQLPPVAAATRTARTAVVRRAVVGRLRAIPRPRATAGARLAA